MPELHPSVMSAELQDYLSTASWCQAAVREVTVMLPTGEEELDRLIGATVEAKDLQGFMFVVCAALGAGRRVDARHLHYGARLIPDEPSVACIAWHTEGDVAENLVAAVRDTRMLPKNAVTSLFVAAAWCQEQQREALPKNLIPLARQAARAMAKGPHLVFPLFSLGQITSDPGLQALLDAFEDKPEADKVRQYREALMVFCRTPVLTLVPVAQPKVMAQGTTMRRSVARVGRNESCPCGSGRKYKKCCAEKDQARLHQSSSVAGHTKAEVWVDPERHLTLPILKQTAPHILARFDVMKMPAPLRPGFLLQLAEYSLVEEAVAGIEKVGYGAELNEVWKASAYYVAQADRGDLLQRLMAMRQDRESALDEIGLGGHLLLAGNDANAIYRVLDQYAMEALTSEDPAQLKSTAFGGLACRLRPLGILVARGLIPLLPKEDASFIFEQLLGARDKLNLPPEDQFGEVWEKRLLEKDDRDGKGAETLRAAQGRLEEKAKEVRQLKESLAQVTRELDRRQKRAPEPTAPAAPAPAVDETALKELREKVGKLKEALKERHEERNDLRRELQKAHANLEALQQSGPAPSNEERAETDREDALLLPEEATGTQPVRTIEFPKGFQEKLASLPRSVARGTMTMLGRIAAGEPAAFVGAVRLKACASVMRVRMGSDFRLLFRLLPDCVQVVDLIPRQDLERRIKTLLKSSMAA